MADYRYQLLPSHSPSSPSFSGFPKHSRRTTVRTCLGLLSILFIASTLVYHSFYYQSSPVEVVQEPVSDSPQQSFDDLPRPPRPEDYTLIDLTRNAGPLTFIPYTFGYPMLLQSLNLYKRAGWHNLIIIDNSWNRDAWNDRTRLRTELGVSKVVLTTAHLRFSQIMNVIDTLALALGEEYYFWSHSDVFLVSQLTDRPSPYQLAVECINKTMETDSETGVVFLETYDWLSAVRVEAGRKAPWDPAMMQYGSDCDRYSRIRKAGFKTIDAKDVCSGFEPAFGTLFNMQGVLNSKEESAVLAYDTPYEERLEIIRKATKNTENYQWRLEGKGGMDDVDKKADNSYKTGGMEYYAAKWGMILDKECALDRAARPYFDLPAAPPRIQPLQADGPG